jgi:SpoVK/Ycf46/Vps4 family AAA+-type ATPase
MPGPGAGDLPRGVTGVHVLPADHHDGPWDSIVVPGGTRERLLGTALVAMLHARRLSALPAAAAPSGLIVLAGPPGTGKTTLAHGLAQAAALAVAPRGATTLIEIDPHAMPSEMLGESQRNVVRLLRDVVPSLAGSRQHVVVVIDEVESFAMRRSLASFETNPVDVQRATDAVLAGLDHLAATLPGAVVVTTTNFVSAVDEAFLSRADLVTQLDLPDAAARTAIIAAALADLALAWPSLGDLALDATLHAEVAAATPGWDGRRLRKLPLTALGSDPALARDPASLTAGRLRAAIDWPRADARHCSPGEGGRPAGPRH